MADEHVSIIRKCSRDLLNFNRKIHREVESDLHRPVKDLSISKEDIERISNKLKTKSKVYVSELQTIKNGIMENQKYIEVVLSIHGALRGIIREFTGNNARNQLAAAGCCCNLALGDEKACLVVAKATGSYLTAELDSLNKELAVTSAWTTGNLAGSGPRVCTVLVSQGALAKLIELVGNEELSDAAIYALEHFAYQMKDELRSEYLAKILSCIKQTDFCTDVSRLLFVLSCHRDFPDILTEELLQKILSQLPGSIEEYLNCSHKDTCRLVYIIRTLANSDKCDMVLNFLTINNMSVAIKQILCTNNGTLNDSLLWLLGNLFRHLRGHIQDRTKWKLKRKLRLTKVMHICVALFISA